MAVDTTEQNNRSLAITLNRAAYALSRNWFAWMVVLTGGWVILPWLAPVFMKLGWVGPAQAIYGFYSLQCHQLPQRSFFLFGSEYMYSLEQIQEVWQSTFNPVILRRFLGTPAMGYKVAWSDRMVSAYSSILLAALTWWPLRRRARSISIFGLLVFMLPMAIDGGTHVISDLAGIGQGFRDTNAWLAILTNNSLPTTFYVGDALGSFNSWMRLITGVLFGFGIAWFSLPYFHQAFRESAQLIEEKFDRAGKKL